MNKDKILPIDSLIHEILKRLKIDFDVVVSENFQYAKLSERDLKRVISYKKAMLRGNK